MTTAVDVVKIEKLQYLNFVSWVDVPSTIYVLKGTRVSFRAVKDPPTANWPVLKPVWSGAPGVPLLAANLLDPTASYRDVTFAALGDKTVSAECGNTKTVNVKVLDLVVEFWPGEARPGIGANRVKTVTATAKRTAGSGAVTIDLSTDDSRATVSPNSFTLPAGQATQNQQLTIQGTALSQNDRDTNLIAKVGADTVGKMPITVVAPKNWTNDCLAAPLTGGPTANTNNENPPPKDWEVRWVVPVTFTVLDQFEKPLDLLWAGVLMFERVVGGSWYGFDINNPTAGTPSMPTRKLQTPFSITSPAGQRTTRR